MALVLVLGSDALPHFPDVLTAVKPNGSLGVSNALSFSFSFVVSVAAVPHPPPEPHPSLLLPHPPPPVSPHPPDALSPPPVFPHPLPLEAPDQPVSGAPHPPPVSAELVGPVDRASCGTDAAPHPPLASLDPHPFPHVGSCSFSLSLVVALRGPAGRGLLNPEPDAALVLPPRPLLQPLSPEGLPKGGAPPLPRPRPRGPPPG